MEVGIPTFSFGARGGVRHNAGIDEMHKYTIYKSVLKHTQRCTKTHCTLIKMIYCAPICSRPNIVRQYTSIILQERGVRTHTVVVVVVVVRIVTKKPTPIEVVIVVRSPIPLLFENVSNGSPLLRHCTCLPRARTVAGSATQTNIQVSSIRWKYCCFCFYYFFNIQVNRLGVCCFFPFF